MRDRDHRGEGLFSYVRCEARVPVDHPLPAICGIVADKVYDIAGFVAALLDIKVALHVAQNNTNRRLAIDGRTTRQPAYAVSIRIRKRIEEIIGWAKTCGGMHKARHCGQYRVGWAFKLRQPTIWSGYQSCWRHSCVQNLGKGSFQSATGAREYQNLRK